MDDPALLYFVRLVPFSKLSRLPGRKDGGSWEGVISRRKGYLSSDARDLFLHAIAIANDLMLESSCPKDAIAA